MGECPFWHEWYKQNKTRENKKGVKTKQTTLNLNDVESIWLYKKNVLQSCSGTCLLKT